MKQGQKLSHQDARARNMAGLEGVTSDATRDLAENWSWPWVQKKRAVSKGAGLRVRALESSKVGF